MTSRARFVPSLALLILALTAIILAEASLQILERIVPTFELVLFQDGRRTIPDARLFNRGNPNFVEHDENGFRNPEVPANAQIVAIGDSHTYGTTVRPTEAWSQVLDRLSGCKVYNMALGGYGPLEYAELARNSIHLAPRILVVGIYFGNDFYDNWQMYRSNPTRYPVPQALLRPANQLESRSPLKLKIVDFFRMGRPARKKQTSSWNSLKSNFSLYGFFRAIGRQAKKSSGVLSRSFEDAVAALTARQMRYASVFNDGDWRTIFTSRYRAAVQDVSDPIIAVGRWLTQWAIEDIRDTARSVGASVLFVLLPTKEAAFSAKAGERTQHNYYENLVHYEDTNRRYLIKFLSDRNIAYLDAVQVLGRMSEQPYFESADGHPNPRGHEAIANAINASIQSCKPGSRVVD